MGNVDAYLKKSRAIKRFREMVRTGSKPEDLRLILEMLLIGSRLWSQTMPDETPLYRGRKFEKGGLFSHADQLKYPACRFVTNAGRFNNAGESIFYGSNTELGTLIEMRPDLLKLFVISEVRLKPGGIQPLLLRLISDSPNYSGVLESADRPSTLVEELLEKFVLTEVTRPGSSGYNGSIAIGKQFFRVGLLQARNTPYKGHKRLALAYPSVYAPEICNVPTYNIAMHPETFDACFSVTKADVYSLTHDISSNRLVLISHNTGAVCSNGEIAWQHSYEEMIGRTKNGIFGLGIREERIKGVADLM